MLRLAGPGSGRRARRAPWSVACAGALGGWLLASCGGSASSDFSPHSLQVAMYGDSTTEGWSWNGSSYVTLAGNEPAVVQRLLEQRFPFVRVANEGVVGTALDALLAGDKGYARSWYETMAASEACIVVLNFGINDSHEPGMTPATFGAELRAAVRVARARRKTVVLETSNPVADPADALLPQLVEQERSVAAQEQVALIDQYAYLSQWDWDAYLSDGIHPTAQGYAVKGRYAAEVLAPIVQRMHDLCPQGEFFRPCPCDPRAQQP